MISFKVVVIVVVVVGGNDDANIRLELNAASRRKGRRGDPVQRAIIECVERERRTLAGFSLTHLARRWLFMQKRARLVTEVTVIGAPTNMCSVNRQEGAHIVCVNYASQITDALVDYYSSTGTIIICPPHPLPPT